MVKDKKETKKKVIKASKKEEKKNNNQKITEDKLFLFVKLFDEKHKKLPKIIKKNEFTDEHLVEYYVIVKTLLFMLMQTNDVKEIISKNKKLKQKQVDTLIVDLKKQLEWCEKQMNFRNEIRKNSMQTIVDYQDEIIQRYKILGENKNEKL